ncbi:hypothetical protein HNQ71_004625 [Mesorhizobium sangaii]|uniref:Uncharacterized protein n=1 Tax=Mesorhizobium sangaii TaxID=505389 RepID=A0A841P9P5_9HYPH|nr:hypothetical protein [Mesorhizobium sangaii]
MTTKTAILQAIRQKCLDCSGCQPAEVRECPVSTCGLWLFRLGMDPDPSRIRGFAKSPVYTGDFEEGTTKGTQVAQMPSPSRNGFLHASFGESGAIVAGSIDLEP